ncbi:MAG TPA: PQQ-binding-like beta-propeller repeat protein [Solirubrobacteraceae bacterium]|nr:PQQ-binding-like beta-propeller repeat protein [Solirubrobacteraceae bacterium]
MSPRSALTFIGSVILALALAACGASHGAARAGASAATPTLARIADHRAVPARIPSGDWRTFDANAARSGAGPADTGITARDLGALRRRTVALDGVVDASVIEAAGVRVGGRRRDVVVLTTDYGRTEALDAATGQRLWEFTPRSVARLEGGPQITTATPVLDPSGRYVYAASPDGYIHKLVLADGRALWATAVTHDAHHEKLAGALNLDGAELVAETGGYDGDYPPYVGHVVTIDLANGRITHVFNTLCSNIHAIIARPGECGQSDSAIWGRPGAVIEPNHDILVSTGNGNFNGRTDWGDSVLELSPSLRLLHNWTPANQAQLYASDRDLGSTEPVLLPVRGGRRYAVQGGKDGILRLLDLNALAGGHGAAGPRTGGELQSIDAPGPTDIFSQPAVWHSSVFVADGAGTAAYRYGSDDRLHRLWENGTSGTSPVIAGGLLYVYDENAGALDVYAPSSGRRLAALPAAPGHWNSPTVIGGRIFLPVGNDNDHATSGEMFIWRLPRR